MIVNTGLTDTISRLNQGRASRLLFIKLFPTKYNLSICKKLLAIGILANIHVKNGELQAFYKYKGGRCNFIRIVVLSKKRNREYWNLSKIMRFKESTSATIIIFSTKKGLLMDSECLWMRIGGEPLFKIFL